MAKVLSKTGVQSGQTIQAFHVSQSVDAFTGQSAYDITVSGSLNVNGYSLPTVDGVENQVMVTDGSGTVTFQTLPTANTASFVTASGVWGPYGSNSIQTASFAVSASHVEFADVASASYHAINASDANTATTASYARTASVVTDPNVVLLDANNTFTGQTQTFTNDIVVNGTASFTYFQSVTGSAKIIGDAFIVLNNNTPAERYAGIQVQDSGSAGVTASLEFDGQTNDWFYEYSDDGGATTDHGVVLFGEAYDTKGSPIYPSNNTIQKGTGEHHLVDSSIIDNGTTVSTSLPFTATQITASTGFKGDLVGNVTGTSTTASYVEYTNVANKPTLLSSSAQISSDISGAFSESSASFSTRITSLEEFSSSLDANFATEAELNAATASLSSSLATDISTNKSNLDTLEAKTLVSGSSQVTLQSTTGNLSGSRIVGAVPNATSASYSLTASYALSSGPQVSASYALTASYALNAESATVDTGSLLVTASAAGSTITFTKGDSTTFDVTINTGSIESSSFATTASHAEFADNSRDSVSSSYALTASYALNVPTFVESSSYAETSSIRYDSGSGVVTGLSELKINDFDDNVGVTFQNNKLTLTFGSPTDPSISSFINSGFATDRFNKVEDASTVTANWSNGGFTFVSASILTGSTVLTTTNTPGDTSLTLAQTTSGSQQYTLIYTGSSPLDGSDFKLSSTVTSTLSKTNPTNPSISDTVTIQLGDASNQFEQGATGSIAFSSAYGSSNGWDQVSLVNTPANTPIEVTGSATGSSSITIQAVASYESPDGENDPQRTTSRTSTTTFSKIRSLRYGASSATSFTQTELEDLGAWDTTLGGDIGTIDKGNTNPSGDTITITWSGDKYQYIIYDSSRSDLTNITTSGFSVLGQFTKSTVGDYKVYRTTALQAGGGGSSITYILT